MLGGKTKFGMHRHISEFHIANLGTLYFKSYDNYTYLATVVCFIYRKSFTQAGTSVLSTGGCPMNRIHR